MDGEDARSETRPERAARAVRPRRFAPYARVERLRRAAYTNDTETVKSLLAEGADPNLPDEQLRRPLHVAACSGYVDVVRALLTGGADPNARDTLGNTPLHLAACTPHATVVRELLGAGTDASALNEHGRSPLQLARSKLQLVSARLGGSPDLIGLRANVEAIVTDVCEYLLERAKRKERPQTEYDELLKRIDGIKMADEPEKEIAGLLEHLERVNLTQ